MTDLKSASQPNWVASKEHHQQQQHQLQRQQRRQQQQQKKLRLTDSCKKGKELIEVNHRESDWKLRIAKPHLCDTFEKTNNNFNNKILIVEHLNNTYLIPLVVVTAKEQEETLIYCIERIGNFKEVFGLVAS